MKNIKLSAFVQAKSVCAIQQHKTIQRHLYTNSRKFTEKTLKKQLRKGLIALLFKRSLKDLEFFGFYEGCGDRHHTRKFDHYAA